MVESPPDVEIAEPDDASLEILLMRYNNELVTPGAGLRGEVRAGDCEVRRNERRMGLHYSIK